MLESFVTVGHLFIIFCIKLLIKTAFLFYLFMNLALNNFVTPKGCR